MILGIDTATAATAAAVWTPDGLEREARDDPAPGARPNHATRLLALVEEVVQDDWEHVTRIAVGVGPGGFTGPAPRHRHRPRARPGPRPPAGRRVEPGGAGRGREPRRPRLAVIDARRGEVFATPPALLEPQAIAPADLAARLVAGALAVGDGAVRFREELERAGAIVPADDSPVHRVSALQVCRLGAAGEPAGRDALVPDYRREPDASPR